MTASPAQISGMTPKAQLPSIGAYVPVVIDGDQTNYRYDLGVNLTGWVNVRQFGASPAASAAVNGDAFDAAIAFIRLYAATGYGSGPGGGTLFVPAGAYNLDRTLDIYDTMTLRGEGVGEVGGVSTVLLFPAGVTGIRVQGAITSGAAGTRASDGHLGDGAIIERLALQGGYVHGTTAEGEYHGIHLRGRATIQECSINLFQGGGVYANASAGSGGATEGNVNNAYVSRVTVSGCRDGVFFQGADSNAGTFIMVDALYNRRWGIWDNSFLGNAHLGHHTSGNGVVNVGSGIPYTQVSYSSKIYSLVQGGNSAIAPSGTTADTANWYYVRAGGVTATAPAWSAVLSVRDGGPYFSGRSQYRDCYAESDQGVTQVNSFAAAVGGTFLSGVKGAGRWEYPTTGGTSQGVVSSAGVRFTGDNPNFNGGAGLELYMFSGSAAINAYNRDGAVSVPLIIGALSHRFDVSGVAKATLDGTGISLAAGSVYKVGGTQVVGAQQAGCPAAATDLASVITLANFLRTAGLAHGLIAP